MADQAAQRRHDTAGASAAICGGTGVEQEASQEVWLSSACSGTGFHAQL